MVLARALWLDFDTCIMCAHCYWARKMNGAVLIFSLCLQAQCAELRLPMPEASILTCNAQAQPTVAKWIEEHATQKDSVLTGWRCVEAGSEDDLL